MSKIGNKPIPVTASIQTEIADRSVSVKGSHGTLKFALPRHIVISRENDQLILKNTKKNGVADPLHGLFRSLIANAVLGVEKPWERRLEVVGTGFNVKQQGEDIVFKVGYSHPVVFKKVEGITLKVEGNNKVVVSGVDKQLVGQVAYQVKIIKKPDAYKGKGIRYEGERVRIKPGKKAKAAA